MTDFNNIINRTGTYSTQWDFIQDRFGRGDLLPFTISDMDIAMPPIMQEALISRVQHGIFGYTRWNHDDYKGSIVHWYKDSYQANIQESWISYTPNVIYALTRFLDLLDPNHKGVSLITPCYDGFMKILKANKFPIFPIAQSIIEKEYRLDWNKLEDAISQSGVFLLCNPNNPNGYLWTREDLEKIVKTCKKHGVAIISDDIHMDYVYGTKSIIPITTVAEELDYLDKVVIISSASKTFNISGLGGAYVLCPNQKINDTFQFILKEKDSLSSAMALNVLATIVGYTECKPWLEELKAYFYNNLSFVDNYLKTNLPEIKFTIPEATYFAWLDCSGLGLSSEQFQDKLVNKGKVAIMGGTPYQEPKTFLRYNVACPLSKVKEGLERICLSLK